MDETKDKLVSYRDFPYGLKRYGLSDVIPLTREEFDERKSTLPYECFDNCYMPRLYWQVTGRCNLRCKHCFSAAEWSLAEAEDLLRQARDAGMCAVVLTGGEPTLHGELTAILRRMKENGLTLLAFNTNGFDLSDEVLDTFEELGFDPNIKISLDGIGRHDEFRGVIGSEARALEAMRRCKARGYRVYTQTQVNRQTVNTLPRMLDTAEDIGLTSVRLIKTTETPRWAQNGEGDNFGFDEYYREVLKLIRYQIETGHRTDLDIWECVYVDMQHREESFFPSCVIRTGNVRMRYALL